MVLGRFTHTPTVSRLSHADLDEGEWESAITRHITYTLRTRCYIAVELLSATVNTPKLTNSKYKQQSHSQLDIQTSRYLKLKPPSPDAQLNIHPKRSTRHRTNFPQKTDTQTSEHPST